MKNLILLFVLIAITACGSMGEKVVVRMDDMDESPKWATLSKTMFKKKGRVYAVGFAELPIESRISAAVRVSDNNARFEISREIQDDMAFILQNVSEGVSDGGQLVTFYGSEVSKNLIHGIKSEERYWEKVETFDELGSKVFKLRIYSLISIEESELRRAIRSALNKGRGLSPALKKQIDDHMAREIQKLGV